LYRFKKWAATAAVVMAFGLGAARTASAGVAAPPTTVSLDSLLEGGENQNGITIGDKLFDNFNFSSAGQVTLAPKDVEVMFAVDGNQHFLAFLFNLTSTGTARSDLVIGYDLHVLDPARHVTNVGLAFDGGPLQGAPSIAAVTPGRAAATVIESVSTLDGSDLLPGGTHRDTEVISVFNDGAGNLADNFDSTLAINPATNLRFVKDILVSSRGDMGAGISMVENSVTQNGTTIPLPAAFWAAMPILGSLVAGKKVKGMVKRG
jgi:hypothetical protein